MKNDMKNVESFNRDVLQGSYAYYGERLSSRLANERIDKGITDLVRNSFQGKSILDIGSGDGITALFLCKLGAERVVGIDPAKNAVMAAAERCECDPISKGKTQFIAADIEHFSSTEHFDVVVFSRVIHHLPDPAGGIRKAAAFAPAVLIIEPNGWNPVLKIIEKVSPYHRTHDEKSYTPATLVKWLETAGYMVRRSSYINLVPMFSPDWIARTCKFFEPIVESIPIVNSLCCGQFLLYGSA
jgi:SAM-dependent methyltransferase